MNFLAHLDKRYRPIWIVIGFALIGIIGIVDFLSGYELAFSLFYLFPIFLVTWLTNRRLGLVASFISASVWLIADVAAGSSYSHPMIYAWNSLVRLVLFVINVLLLSSLQQTLDHERELARTDFLTGAFNSRIFYELVQMEINRFQRYQHPFTLAYIDLDNFKHVNDQFGHSTGDQVLRTVAHSVRMYLRKSDVVARLGGDEFALLLIETDQDSARVVLSKIHGILLDEMRLRNWPITFSIGVLTCKNGQHTTDELVRMADDLMYSVKNDGKNDIQYALCAG